VKLLAVYLIAWPLFWAGHAVSKVMNLHDALGWLYPAYNRLMCWSCAVSDWEGSERIWKRSTP
jgi:hypothetical protein